MSVTATYSTYSELAPAACRVCLAVDVRLHTIADTPLQLVYEKITNISLHTNDKRPVSACYICYALLYKSGKLLLTAAKAEKILADLYEKNSKITTESISLIDREASGLTGSLTASVAEYFDNVPPAKDDNLYEIKTEPGSEDVYTKMEFEDSTCYPQSPFEDACNNHDETHDKCVDRIPVNSFIDEEDLAGEFQVEKRSRKGYPKSPHEDASNNNDETYEKCEDDISVTGIIAQQQSNAAGEFLVEKRILKDKVENNRVETKSRSRKTEEKQYTCNDCQQIFKRKGYFQRHIKSLTCKKKQGDTNQKPSKNIPDLRMHSEESPYQCKMCPSKFNYVHNLSRHVKTMHESRAFECDICHHKFNRKDYLKNHMKLHFNDKLYECSICKNQYKDQSNYNRHLKQHTKEKSHECNICHNKFTLLHHLKTHLRNHSGERPFKCEYCSMTFSHQSHFKTHTRTHTGVKPFECNICERRFNRRTHLLSHLNVHSKQAK